MASDPGYLPFADLMALNRLDRDGSTGRFRSIAPAFGPGLFEAAYGGHVFAQAAWAAAQTVPEGFVVHNVTGSFLLPVNRTIPINYTVRSLRDKGSYISRVVDAFQHSKEELCYSCSCSFKRPGRTEPDSEVVQANHQQPKEPRKKFEAVLRGKTLDDWPEEPSVDSPWYREYVRNGGNNDAFPGLTMRQVDMDDYNASRSPLDRRQFRFYAALGDMPPPTTTRALNLHACAHLYASDRNGLFAVPNFLDFGDAFTRMATLTHAVVLHTTDAKCIATTHPAQDGREAATSAKRSVETVGAVDREEVAGERRWFCLEGRLERVSDGRGLHCSGIWDDNGVHTASTPQDGLVTLRRVDNGKL